MTGYLDGNMLAGPLAELFAVDVTAAVAECASCGASGAIAQARVFADAPGQVARCPACGEVILRLARGPDRAWLDLRGVTCLQLAVPGPEEAP
jgi:predicted RNA-binding Zn-ribbon protein involved in translation (DUF1610 family)